MNQGAQPPADEQATRPTPRLVADNKGLVAENIGKRFKKRHLSSFSVLG